MRQPTSSARESALLSYSSATVPPCNGCSLMPAIATVLSRNVGTRTHDPPVAQPEANAHTPLWGPVETVRTGAGDLRAARATLHCSTGNARQDATGAS